MKELIELLNQFEEEKKSDNHWGLTYDNELIGLGNIREARLSVISKEYGFIKWLVDNKKIDFTKDNIVEFGYYGTEGYCDKYDNILMNLSIQDNPISFLISILK